MKSRTKIFYYAALIICISVTSCNSQPQKNNSRNLEGIDQPIVIKAKEYVKTFFQTYKSKGANPAIDYIFSKSKSASGVENLKNKLDSLRNELGAFVTAEQITQKNVAAGLVLFSYLAKYQNHPLRFTFIFYKPVDEWELYRFYFDTTVVEELEAAGKVYFIQ